MSSGSSSCAGDRQRAFSGAPWEAKVGYCRAIRVGSIVAVTGTAPVRNDGMVHAPGDAYEQAKRCLEIIEKALAEVGARREDVIRTRMFVTDVSRWQEYGRAHGEYFRDHPPATTMVEVRALIDPQMLIEIEADAVIGEGQPPTERGSTRRFLEEMLGLEWVGHSEDKTYCTAALRRMEGSMQLFQVQRRTSSFSEGDSVDLQLSPQDLNLAIQRLTERGIPFTKSIETSKGRSVYLKDRDGVKWTLVAYPVLPVRPFGERDRSWLEETQTKLWGAPFVITSGRKVFPSTLPGFVAENRQGKRIGLVTYEIQGERCEVVTLDALIRNHAVGTCLLETVRDAAKEAGCRWLWLVTTNDNLDAVRFYQRRGFALVEVRRNAIDESRRLKPSIPVIGSYGVPIRDELVLEMGL